MDGHKHVRHGLVQIEAIEVEFVANVRAWWLERPRAVCHVSSSSTGVIGRLRTCCAAEGGHLRLVERDGATDYELLTNQGWRDGFALTLSGTICTGEGLTEVSARIGPRPGVRMLVGTWATLGLASSAAAGAFLSVVLWDTKSVPPEMAWFLLPIGAFSVPLWRIVAAARDLAQLERWQGIVCDDHRETTADG